MKKPVNILNKGKFKKIIIDRTHLVEIKIYQNSYNITKPFYKPISKIL